MNKIRKHTFKKRVNAIRNTVMGRITKSIGEPDKEMNINDITVNRVFISKPNSRLGNQLLTTPLVQEVSTLYPSCKIDIFVRGYIATPVFKNYPNVNRIIKLPQKPFNNVFKYLYAWIKLRKNKYDLVINVENGSSSGKISTKVVTSKRIIYNIFDEELNSTFSDYLHNAKTPVYNLRKCFYGDINLFKDKPLPLLDLKLDSTEKANGKTVLKQLVGNDKKNICVYTYATGDKCYTETWWTSLYNMLMEKYGDEYNIIEILPKEKISQISFKAPSFYSKDIREIASLVSNTNYYISGDCGMMHMACASGVTTIGLFSVTRINVYGPYGNGSISIDTNNKKVEDIMNTISGVIS